MPVAEPTQVPHSSERVFDGDALYALCAGDQDLLRRLLEATLGSHARTPEELRRCIRAADMRNLAQLAHRVNNVAGALGAGAVASTAGELEIAANRQTEDWVELAERLASRMESMLAEANVRLRTVAAEAGSPSAASVVVGAVSARLLLVDDDSLIRELLRSRLEYPGLEIDEADDGIEAVKMVERRRYDLVLMDLQMTKMNGDDAARRIRAVPERAGMPIIALTSLVTDEIRRACLASGMDDVIEKAYDSERLDSLLARWLAIPLKGAGKE